MAIFNPQVAPDNVRDPNYFKYSDSISQPKADESGGIALKTLGEGIEGGAKLADTVVKDVIKTDVYNRVDAERDKFTTALSNAATYGDANGPSPQQPDSPVGENGPNPVPVNLLANNNVSVPNAISKGIRGIAMNEEGLKQDKVTQTEYIKNLNTITKDLRTTYPGYREYIDTEVSKITGINPANAMIDQYITNINAAMANKNKDQEYWGHKIVENAGFPASDEVMVQYQKDHDSAKVMKWLSVNQGAINMLQLKKAAYESADSDKKSQVETATDYAQTAVNHAATIMFKNKEMFGGMTPSDIADKMYDLTLHPEKGNDVAYQNLGAQYMAMEAAATNQATMLLKQRVKGPDGKLMPSVEDTIGPEAAGKLVKNSISNLFQATHTLIADKQFSPAYSLQQQAQATQDNAMMKVFKDPSINGQVLTASVFNKLIPQLSPLIINKLLGDGIDNDIKPVMTTIGQQAIAQTGGKYQGINGTVYSFRQSQEELAQAENIANKKIPGAAFNNLLGITKVITDPAADPKAKSNAITYFYDPVNKGTMSKFMDDYYDTAKGGMVKGRSSAYAVLTSEDVTEGVWNNGGKSAASADWQKYSSWAKGEFNTQLGTAVKDLNDIQSTEGGHFSISWDNKEHRFGIHNQDGSDLTGLQATSLNLPYRTVQNINMGLSSISNIAKREGSNVDAYLFKTLKDSGWSPTKDIDGIGAQMMNALMVANGHVTKKDLERPRAPVSKYSDEPVGGDLKSFLTNPAGSKASEGPILEPYQTRNVIHGNLSDQPIDAPIRTNQ